MGSEAAHATTRQMGVDEIYRGKKGKFLTVVCNLETGEPLWFGRERKKETLDDFFRSQLTSRAAEADRGGLRRHVGTIPAKHRAMGA
ncbi:MAG TPA: transposase [Bryobacteraceae bacterium]|nr:transposase [Bryobacteraceae bacterium]